MTVIASRVEGQAPAAVPEPAVQAPDAVAWKRHWKRQLNRLKGLPLLAVGAGPDRKAPANLRNGQLLVGWPTTAHTPAQIETAHRRICGAGTRTGKAAGGLLVLDVDGASAVSWLLERGCDPLEAQTWQIHRNTDTERLKIAWRLSGEQQSLLGRIKRQVKTRPAVKDASGKVLEKGEAVELFHGDGQVVVLGEHPTSKGFYWWPEGRGPEALALCPPIWWEAVLQIAQPPAAPVTSASGRGASSSRGAWRRLQHCPICGRNERQFCSIHHDGRTLRCFHGSTFSPVQAHGQLRAGDEITDAQGQAWAFSRVQESAGEAFSIFVAPDPTRRRSQRRNGSDGAVLVEATPQPPASEGDGENKPFRVLGWCAERKSIWYQHRQTGQIANIKPTATAGPLLQLAPIGWWATFHTNGRAGVDWTEACSEVIDAANAEGVFAPERIRGRGVWMEGDRTIWHLGDRLEVDGVEIGLADHRSAHHYARLPVLPIDRTVAPLSDAEGQRILSAVAAMGWSTPLDHLHLLGWAVLANVGGALEKRPVLQLTSKFGSGKTFTRERVLQPLLAGLAISRSGSTEAGIRQILKADTLPVLIDESEGEDHGRREGHLRLARLSYDGSPSDRGTTHGQAITYAVRSSVATVGINTAITNPADRSRTVVVGRKQLEQDQWADVDRHLQELLTPVTGARLLRRAINHLPTLRANVATFRRVVEGQLRMGAAARAGDTLGALLAGAHLLVSTAQVDDAQAVDWLDSIGWSASLALGEAGAEEQDATAESRQCLAHLLSHEEVWRLLEDERGTGRISIRELINLARIPSGADDAEQARKALGRRGIRATDSGLAIANTPEALAPIYGKTKWRDGGHRARLLDLEGAYAAGMVRFPVLGLARACTIPWEVAA